MKVIYKVILILIIAFCVIGTIKPNISYASATDVMNTVKPEEPNGKVTKGSIKGLQRMVGKILGFLQIASGLISIVVIAFTGFEFIISTPEAKKELKDKMLPIIVGLIMVFSAVSISKFMLGMV